MRIIGIGQSGAQRPRSPEHFFKKVTPAIRAAGLGRGSAAPDGRVNTSPKEMKPLHILSDQKTRWLNLLGSGSETAAHLGLSDGITLMFCAFNGDAEIMRVYSRCYTTYHYEADWNSKTIDFLKLAGSRQIFDLEIDMVQASYRSAVQVMSFESDRGSQKLVPFYEKKMGPAGVTEYWRKRNMLSIDGYPTGVLNET